MNYYNKGNMEMEAMWEDKVEFRTQYGTKVRKTSEKAFKLERSYCPDNDRTCTHCRTDSLIHKAIVKRLSTGAVQSELCGEIYRYNAVICQGQCQYILFAE